jgi:hypothetical protein
MFAEPGGASVFGGFSSGDLPTAVLPEAGYAVDNLGGNSGSFLSWF